MSNRTTLEELRDREAILARINENQLAYIDAETSPKRFIPLWRTRKQYRLCKLNEPLFEQLSIHVEPFSFETRKGLSWAITRRLIGA